LKAPEWIEYRPLGQAGAWDESELIARIHLPDADYRVAFVFVTRGDQTKFHDLWLALAGAKLMTENLDGANIG
jgi:hypothetical protein